MMPPTKKIAAWSYSRWADYQTCPFKAKCKYVLKLKEPGGDAMNRGSDIHKKLENYLNYKMKRVPTEAKLLKKEYVAMKKLKPEVELSVAFTNTWEKTDWFNPTKAWCRVKIDALTLPTESNPVVEITDHKTGKVKEHGEYNNQLELYGLTGLLLYDMAEKSRSNLLFVDHGIIIAGEEYPRKDINKLKKKWEIRVAPMLKDTKFKPSPGMHCRWCHYRKSNGGPCAEG